MESAYSVGKAGLTPAMKVATGTQLGPLSDNVSKFASAYKRLKALGYTDAEFQQMTAATLHLLKAVWDGHDQADFTYCLSRMPVELTTGDYVLSFPLELSAAEMFGQGTSAYYNYHKGSTQLRFDRAYWKAKPTEQRFVRNANWGHADNYGYTEDFGLDLVRLTGDWTGAFDPSKPMHAIGLWKTGENSSLADKKVKIENFNGAGVELQNGTPFYFGNLSVFNCAGAALELAGCALSTMRGGLLTTDDNTVAVRSRKGMNDEAGISGSIDAIKVETGVTDEARGLWKGECVLDLEGQIALNIGAVWMKGAGVHIDALAVIKPYLSNGAFQGSQLTIGAFKADGFSTVLHQITPDGNGKRWYGLPGYAGTSLKYNSVNGGMVECFGYTLQSGAVKSTKRLGIQRWNGSSFAPAYDYANGTPIYTLDSGGVAPTPPTPPVTPPVEPPVTPPAGTKFSGGPYSVTSPTFNVVVNVPGVTVVNLAGFKATNLNWGRVIGTGGGGPSLQVGTDGYWYWNGAKQTSWPKVVVGTAKDYSMTLPSPVTVSCLFQTDPSQGGAALCTVTKVELK